MTVFSTTPTWFWGNLRVNHIQYQADVGCIQKETLSIDEHATRRACLTFDLELENRFGVFSALCSQNSFDLVVTDIAPEPLEFANRLSIPSALIANFTWVEIYSRMQPMSDLIPNILHQYKQATRTYIPGFQTGMEWVDDTIIVDPVAEAGKSIRNTLDPDAKYARLIYIDAGRWGTEIGWANASQFQDTLFIRVGQPIDGLPINVLQLDFGKIKHADVVSSVDIVVSKPGYGIVTECLANKTHWCCIPRDGFAEDEVLIGVASNSGKFSMASPSQLISLSFPEVIDQQINSATTFDGARQITQRLLESLTG